MSAIGRRIPSFDHEIALGEQVRLDAFIRDPAGSVLDLTGFSARYTIANQRGEVIEGFSPEILDNVIHVRALVTASPPGVYQHELRARSASGGELVLFRGSLRVLARLGVFA